MPERWLVHGSIDDSDDQPADLRRNARSIEHRSRTRAGAVGGNAVAAFARSGGTRSGPCSRRAYASAHRRGGTPTELPGCEGSVPTRVAQVQSRPEHATRSVGRATG